ncbi:MAG: hypothetical protein KGI60_03955 [Patescibacteria group bacterium]|nr:hypothetical protein [Patescibacteria group bacterium]
MDIHLGMLTGGLFVAAMGVQLVTNGTSSASLKLGILLTIAGFALMYFSFRDNRNLYRLRRQLRSLKQGIFGS